ncbi:putative short-chain dehydrogenases/reductase [Rhizodiscina lignyota]|uniref:Short-chain dehydrogenases/reductase n=1 Tax=Rhizodiscina lignyota TaxID=1504668 RepID=A0A9P4IQT9_9PEZI|nr:putative short-chain dehydrogenases/reductase [Rhizodiscina lignyota]
MPSFLITGANRGLGLAFTKELLKDPKNYVIATARNAQGAEELHKLATQFGNDRLSLLQLDVTKEESIRAAVEQAQDLLPNGLDNFVSNAGVATDMLSPFEAVDLKAFTADVDFTLASTVRVILAFLPLIRKGSQKRIMAISSVLGSIEMAFGMPGVANTYSTAKAALNMMMRKWAAVLKMEGIAAFVIHPGWAGNTAIGAEIEPWMSKYAPNLKSIPESTAAEGCMKVLTKATIDDAGKFFNYDGGNLPW